MRTPLAFSAAGALLLLGAACQVDDEPAPGTSASPFVHDDHPVAEVVEVYLVLDGPGAAAAIPPHLDPGDPEAVKRSRARLAEVDAQQAELRPALEAEGAVIVGALRKLGNAIHLRAPREAVKRFVGWPGIDHAEPVPLFYPLLQTGLLLVGAPQIWAGTPGYQGEGMSVGIIDTGVDYLHAGFGAPGIQADFDDNDSTIIEPGSFPTLRVAGGWDLVGNSYNPDSGNSTPNPDPDPLDCNSHGSHVAGIAAGGGVLTDGTPFSGPYEQSFDPSAFRVAPGVAPKAEIYAIKVFGCGGPTSVFAEGIEWAADPNDDGDMSDRLDVINASLGAAYGGGFTSPVTALIVRNYTMLGGLLVSANGNDGSTFFAAGSGAVYPEALSVGATDGNLWVTLDVSAPTSAAGLYPASEGQFTASLATAGAIAGQLVESQPANGCSPLTNAGAIAGQIAYIQRGDCLFVDKLQNAVDAGAAAAVVVNNNFGQGIFSMGGDPESGSPIPGVMISAEDGQILENALASGITATLDPVVFEGDAAERVAGLSSRGPSLIDGALKPDISAPGVSIASVQVGTGNNPSDKSGTSMATPFVAGAAALVRQAHPEWTPEQVKAAIMSTAETLSNEVGVEYPLTMQGSGRLEVLSAVVAETLVMGEGDDGAVGLSFGAIVVDEPWSGSRSLVVQNNGAAPVTYDVSARQVLELPGVTVAADPTQVTVPAGGSATVELTLSVDPQELGAPGPDANTPEAQFDLPRHWLDEADGYVVLDDVASDARLQLPFHAVVRAAGHREATPALGCSNGGAVSSVILPMSGESPFPDPATSVFELGAVLEQNPQSETDPETASLDLRAVGVATDVATAETPEDVSLFFGLAVDGPWTTPARGRFSTVGVEIDVDGDDDPDFGIVAEPLGKEAPYLDVLAATTYVDDGCAFSGFYFFCEATEGKRFINMVPATTVRSDPYFNSVIVLGTFARNLGLDESNSAFRYRAYTAGVVGVVDQSDWLTFDYAEPRVDAARFAPEEGRPIFDDPSQIEVAVTEPDAAGSYGDLLLLHHHNVRGEHYQVLSLDGFSEQPTDLRHDLPDSAPSDAKLRRRVYVDNASDFALTDVRLRGSISGAALEIAAPDYGGCGKGDDVDCALGEIPPWSTVAVSLQLIPEAAAEALTLDLEATSATGCTTLLEVSTALEPPVAVAPADLDASGGCSCRLAGDPRGAPRGLVWLMAGLGLALRRRRFA